MDRLSFSSNRALAALTFVAWIGAVGLLVLITVVG
jgi:hypothetical protein